MASQNAALSRTQLASALKELDTLLAQGAAELQKRPQQFQLVKNLAADLKKLKPGQAPSAKTVAMLQSFFAQQLDEEIKDQSKLLNDAQKATGPVLAPVSAAHRATLDALTMAKNSLGALSASAAPGLVESAGTRLTNLNAAAERAVANAEAAKAFAAPKPKGAAPRPPRK